MRVHNAQKKLNLWLPEFPQPTFKRKPQGIWWAEDHTWHRAVEEKSISGLGKRVVGSFDYEIALKEEFRLLELRTMDDLREFSIRFGQPMPHARDGFFWQRSGTRDRYDPDQDPEMPGRMRAFLVDWSAVAREWDGVEVGDILLERKGRPRIDWLDTDWGVPSGCAWRVDRLEVREIEPDPDVSP